MPSRHFVAVSVPSVPRATSTAKGAAADAPPPASLVEVASASLGALTARKWRLENGLEVVLVPDPQATNVSYTTWFRVGSRNEDEGGGETGLAHLFEHLMFTQTKSMAADELDRAIEAAGGSSNAMTYYDFTAYVDDVPPREIALAARLEADRMTNLDLRKRQVDNERDVVVEERLSAVEDSVDGTMDEILFKQAFKTHPYRWPVIGWMKDIKAITQEKALAFYKRWYAPNNAVLVVCGDVTVDQVRSVAKKYFGTLKASNHLPPVTQAQMQDRPAEKRIELKLDLEVPVVSLAWHIPPARHEDIPALEVLTAILSDGESSRLYRRMVRETKVAVHAMGFTLLQHDPGLYGVGAAYLPNQNTAEVERLLREEVARVIRDGVTPRELEKAVNQTLSDEIFGAYSADHLAHSLGDAELLEDDFRKSETVLDRYRALKPADVQAAAAKYLSPDREIVLLAEPRSRNWLYWIIGILKSFAALVSGWWDRISAAFK